MTPKFAGSSWRCCLVALTLLALPWGAFGAQDEVSPTVAEITEGYLEIDRLIQVEVKGLDKWSNAKDKNNDPKKLVPYINGMEIRGNYPVEVHQNHLSYRLKSSPENREIWTHLLGAPSKMKKEVTLSVGLEGDPFSPFDTVFGHKNPAKLIVISPLYGVVAAVLTLLTMVLLLRLARTTNLLRESGPCSASGKLRPYNLGRTQMAFWFFLVYVSYLGIWLITDTLDTITVSLLGLIGISAGTALSEALIDSGKDSASAAKLQDLAAEKQALEQGISGLQTQVAGVNARPVLASDDQANRDNLNRQIQDSRTQLTQVNSQIQALTPSASSGISRGFLHDLLSDSSGYSFHRFQIFAWTILLGIMFVSSVYNSLTMPEFNTTLLGLMGISSGTYIGFKFPEQK